MFPYIYRTSIFTFVLFQYNVLVNPFFCVFWKVKMLEIKYNFIITHTLTVIGLMGRVFANGPGDRGSILGRVIPNT